MPINSECHCMSLVLGDELSYCNLISDIIISKWPRCSLEMGLFGCRGVIRNYCSSLCLHTDVWAFIWWRNYCILPSVWCWTAWFNPSGANLIDQSYSSHAHPPLSFFFLLVSHATLCCTGISPNLAPTRMMCTVWLIMSRKCN